VTLYVPARLLRIRGSYPQEATPGDMFLALVSLPSRAIAGVILLVRAIFRCFLALGMRQESITL
jgi:hypothetical protein